MFSQTLDLFFFSFNTPFKPHQSWQCRVFQGGSLVELNRLGVLVASIWAFSYISADGEAGMERGGK